MTVSAWADMLQELRAFATKEEPQDFGPPQVTELIPEFVCYGQKQDSAEKQAAGVEASVQAWKVYADTPLHPELTEAVHLDLALADGTKLGRFNVRNIKPYEPMESMALLEMDRLSTQ